MSSCSPGQVRDRRPACYPMVMALRGKHRAPRGLVVRMSETGAFLREVTREPRFSGGAYRARTGPACCNDGCGKKHGIYSIGKGASKVVKRAKGRS